MKIKTFKLFEGFGKGEYYQEIDEYTFYENVETTIKLSDKEIEKLGSLFNPREIWVLSLDKNQDTGLGPYTWIQRSTREYFYSNFKFIIYKCDDDWYYVDWVKKEEVPKGEYISLVSHSTYYKCDQLDGLLALLKKVKI